MSINISRNIIIYTNIFNRNTLNISYCTTKNIKSIINAHNFKILNEIDSTKSNDIQTCNCIKKDECPLDGKCLTDNLIYKAVISCNQPSYIPRKYLGSAETTFKIRFGNHKKTFKYLKYENDTELSKELWKIKKNGYIPKISWSIHKKCLPYNFNTKRCHLCLNEKLEIATYPGNDLLNKRSELISKCRHETKYVLLRHDTKD